jgi:hypothetical protein
METDEETEKEDDHKHEYLIKSPLLLTSNVKEQQPIAGLNLNDIVPKQALDGNHAHILAASSNNYKKWLNVVL